MIKKYKVTGEESAGRIAVWVRRVIADKALLERELSAARAELAAERAKANADYADAFFDGLHKAKAMFHEYGSSLTDDDFDEASAEMRRELPINPVPLPNALSLLESLRRYQFTCEAGSLETCAEFQDLLQMFSGTKRPAESAPEWIEWHGGECPVEPNCLVDIKTRSGNKNYIPMRAGAFYWRHDSEKLEQFDIIAYRVVSAPAAESKKEGA